VEPVGTKKGQFIEQSFIVHKRTPVINDKELLKLKPVKGKPSHGR
jgi:hypothetical protein